MRESRDSRIWGSVVVHFTDDEWLTIVAELRLAPREADVLRAALTDEGSTMIAAALGLSVSTVSTYKNRLYRRLGVGSISQAIVCAFSAHVRHRNNTGGGRNDAQAG